MKIAFIGIGKVGFALANNLQKSGHAITIAHNDPQNESVREAQSKNGSFSVRPIQEAIDEVDIVFLATPFKFNSDILKPLDFRGKPLVDCTNPVGPGISHGLESTVSGGEMVQEWARDAHVVKSYSIYGYENLADPHFPNYNVQPVMMIAGNDSASKKMVSTLNVDLGFETLDVGELSQALHMEHMTLLWVKMVRANRHPPHFTWALLERK